MCEQDEFTHTETERQDYVDNVIEHTLDRLAGTALEHNIEFIGEIRDTIQKILVDKLKLMTEQQFYPFRELKPDDKSDRPDETNDEGEWVVTVDQLEKAVMNAIQQTDADEFAQLAGDSLGGYCHYNPITQKYYFTPSLSYCGGLDFIKEKN